MKQDFVEILKRSGRLYSRETKRIYLIAIRDLEEIAERSIDEVTPDVVLKWVISLERRKLTIRTRQTYIAAIRLYFRNKPEMLKELPRPKSPPPRTVLNPSEVEKFLKKPKDGLRDEAITSMMYSELTLTEILSLSVEDIDIKEKEAKIEILPGKKGTKPLRRTTLEILKKYIETMGDKNSKLFPISGRTAQNIVKKYHKYATPSLLRRSFTENAYEIGRETLLKT